jgi:hypothetical protein
MMEREFVPTVKRVSAWVFFQMLQTLPPYQYAQGPILRHFTAGIVVAAQWAASIAIFRRQA